MHAGGADKRPANRIAGQRDRAIADRKPPFGRCSMIATAPLAPPRTEVEHSDTIMVDQPTVASHQARRTHVVVRPLSGETDRPGGRSTHSERGQIKIEDRLLFEPAV